ncbi:hypothetical protein ACFLYX_03205 [Chloroflexota bacterium]
MNKKSDLIEQIDLAFDFIRKLYFEVSYLIKEIEVMLNEEEEKFVIGKPSGYGITVRRSAGLEANNVNLWLFTKLAVFFVPEDRTEVRGGQQITKIDDDLKVLYLRIVLQDENEPSVYSGVLHSIKNKGTAKWINKFENLMGHFEYSDDRIFKNPAKIRYQDAYIELKGKLITNNLLEINNGEDIREKIINPSLELYRG